MRFVPTLLLVSAIALAPVPGAGQSGSDGPETAEIASFEALDERNQRRLSYYAEKIVVEIEAIIAASAASDLDQFNLHGRAMKTIAERFLASAEALGLSRADTEAVFQAHLAARETGPLPFFMADDLGKTDLDRLMTLRVVTEIQESSNGDYVSTIRDAGESLFGD